MPSNRFRSNVWLSSELSRERFGAAAVGRALPIRVVRSIVLPPSPNPNMVVPVADPSQPPPFRDLVAERQRALAPRRGRPPRFFRLLSSLTILSSVHGRRVVAFTLENACCSTQSVTTPIDWRGCSSEQQSTTSATAMMLWLDCSGECSWLRLSVTNSPQSTRRWRSAVQLGGVRSSLPMSP